VDRQLQLVRFNTQYDMSDSCGYRDPGLSYWIGYKSQIPAFEPGLSIQNGTDWPDGIAVLMSFLAIIWTMSGYGMTPPVFEFHRRGLTVFSDAPFHLSEECSNANIASPRAIALTAGTGGLMGWALQMVIAYTVTSIPDVMSSPLGQPWASYLIQVLPQKTALAVLAITICCGFSMGQGCMLLHLESLFAYARDGCFPMSFWIRRVNKYTYTPVNAVCSTLAWYLLARLIFGGPVAIVLYSPLGQLLRTLPSQFQSSSRHSSLVIASVVAHGTWGSSASR